MHVTVQAFRGYQQGVLAMIPAAVLSTAVATIAGWPSPLEAIAEQLMVWTPVGLASFLLLHAGSLAAPAALLGGLAIAMLAGGIAGSLQSLWGCGLWRRIGGSLTAAAFLYVVFLAMFPPTIQLPVLWLIGAFLLTLALLSSMSHTVAGRRELLIRSATILGGGAILVALYSVRPLFSPLAPRRLFAFRRPSGLAVSGLAELVTPSDRFYVMDKVLQYPEIGPPSWRLTLDGAVERSVELDYGALLHRGAHHRYITMECVDNPVGGPLIGTALWTGVPVANLLREAGATGDTLLFHTADGYSESAPRRTLEDAGALIAYGMNGEQLPRAHGYPARLVLPGIYGFKSVKWLQRLEVVQGRYSGEWQRRGWTDTAAIRTMSRIDVVRRTGNEILVAGVAFAGTRDVRAVEVRVNAGPWRRATLGRMLSRDSWVQWAIRLRGTGPAAIEARAIDGTGTVQLQHRHGAYPDGSTGWPTATV